MENMNYQANTYDSDYDDEDAVMQEEQEQEVQNQPSQQNHQKIMEKQKIISNQSSIMLTRSHDSSQGSGDCSYCNGKRETFQGLQEGLKSHKSGFGSTKMRCDDFEELLNKGYSRSGTYFYQRNFKMACCETFQYRVWMDKFMPSESQKKAIKRFHRYLNYGTIKKKQGNLNQYNGIDEEQKVEENLDKQQKVNDCNDNINKTSIKVNQSQCKISLENREESEKILRLVKQVVCQNLQSSDQIDLAKVRVSFNAKHNCIATNVLLVIKNLQSIQEQLVNELQNTINTIGEKISFNNIKLENQFINFYQPNTIEFLKEEKQAKQEQYKKEERKKIEKLKKQIDNNIGSNQFEQVRDQYPQNHYKNYLIEYNPQDPIDPNFKPAHSYTIEMRGAFYTEEFYNLYAKYEKTIHKKDREPTNLKRFLCNSPVYDPDRDFNMAMSPSEPDYKYIDSKFRVDKDMGIYPGYGTFHMYHRIDGKLVAVNVIDILRETYVSGYCIYDPEMHFLTLGVVTAIRELEYMRLIKAIYNPQLKYYQLGELAVTCPKVNYKLKYKPGFMICPRTKAYVPIEKCLDQIKILSQMTIEEKISLPYIQIDDYVCEGPLENELLPEIFKEVIKQFPFVYEDTQRLNISALQENGRKLLKGALSEMLMHCGFDLFSKFNFELKFLKEDPKQEKSEKDDQDDTQQQKQVQSH
ncbi:arginyl-trna--protein transferase 1 [Stylonychia lemnae]|uniref:arginyltransferase n=1 Tax=Stylonychia lemnae TaxID=5949 RepID=A0A078B9X5_STYLE|nr:arginyl-trna--protein transferase 1 [Stylonychia lemnae]|eukprot:CDW91315.1 arginyl-trna--protein transferase 1 [Stylonychia lemnae]